LERVVLYGNLSYIRRVQDRASLKQRADKSLLPDLAPLRNRMIAYSDSSLCERSERNCRAAFKDNFGIGSDSEIAGID
jgi:hypothetical protein